MIVSDTSPLIALAKVQHLHLLRDLYQSVSIPQAVFRECLGSRKSDFAILEQAIEQFIHVENIPPLPPEVQIATSSLDIGEKQAIALAYHHKSTLWIDERLGREVARRLQISVTGTVGIFLQAKKTGLIPLVLPLLYEIRGRGYWLSDELLDLAAKMAEEQR